MGWGAGAAPVVITRLDTDHGVHRAALQHLDRDFGHDARPLRALDGLRVARVEHGFVHAKAQRGLVVEVAPAAVHLLLHVLDL